MLNKKKTNTIFKHWNQILHNILLSPIVEVAGNGSKGPKWQFSSYHVQKNCVNTLYIFFLIFRKNRVFINWSKARHSKRPELLWQLHQRRKLSYQVWLLQLKRTIPKYCWSSASVGKTRHSKLAFNYTCISNNSLNLSNQYFKCAEHSQKWRFL